MRTAQKKMQIRAIDCPEGIFVMDFGDYVIFVDGFKGPYIKKEKVVIDISKVKQPKGEGKDVDYREMKKTYIPAKATHQIRLVSIDGRMCIKIKAVEGNNYCWVRYDWLKEYGMDKRFFIDANDNKKPIYIEETNGEPCGIILPVNILNDKED